MWKIIETEEKVKECPTCKSFWHSVKGFVSHNCKKVEEGNYDKLIIWDAPSNEQFDEGCEFPVFDFTGLGGVKSYYAQDRLGEWWEVKDCVEKISDLSFVEEIKRKLAMANRSRRVRIGTLPEAIRFINDYWKVYYGRWEYGFRSCGETTGTGSTTCYFMINIDGQVYFDIKEGPSLDPTVGKTWKSLQPWRVAKVTESMKEKLRAWAGRDVIKINNEDMEIIKKTLEEMK